MSSKKLDVVAVTETWLMAKETSAGLADTTPNGYKLVHKSSQSRGGSVAIMASDTLKMTTCSTPEYSSLSRFVAK